MNPVDLFKAELNARGVTLREWATSHGVPVARVVGVLSGAVRDPYLTRQITDVVGPIEQFRSAALAA